MLLLYTLLAVILVSVISFAGALIIPWSKNPKSLLNMVSFAAGALFGDVFIHLLPEAIKETNNINALFLIILAGIVTMFIVEKIIHWHHCHDLNGHEAEICHTKPLAMINLLGDAAHNAIDGLIIAASFLVSIPVGIATTVAVILHEIPQEIGDFSVLLHAGVTKKRALFLNFLTAITAIAGAIIGIFLGTRIDGLNSVLLPLAAGSFIYIAGSDLIPELHKEVAPLQSAIQLLAFLSGIGIMALLLLVG